MSPKSDRLRVFLEEGNKRIIAGALDWPGWYRMGKDEAEAIQTLCTYAPRYGQVMQRAGIDFALPPDPSRVEIVERLAGTATTDFGAPDRMPTGDDKPIEENEVMRLLAIIDASWDEFWKASRRAEGKELRTGPRGGGRSLDKVMEHVIMGDAAYLSRLGRRTGKLDEMARRDAIALLKEITAEALWAGVRGELPKEGPRGGKIWPVRYFVRRAVWHILDHTWEIEDRIS